MPFIPLTETSILDIPSGTVLETQVYKPHAASAQIIAVAADGRYKVLHEWMLMVDDLIERNKDGETLGAVPASVTVYTRKAWEAMKPSAQIEPEVVRK